METYSVQGSVGVLEPKGAICSYHCRQGLLVDAVNMHGPHAALCSLLTALGIMTSFHGVIAAGLMESATPAPMCAATLCCAQRSAPCH